MAHYAFINPETSTVTEVIVGIDETEEVHGITGTEAWEAFYETQRSGMMCRRTSYNGNIRNKYAAFGDLYLADDDVFVSPAPGRDYTLNRDTWQWERTLLDISDCQCGAEYNPTTGDWICSECP